VCQPGGQPRLDPLGLLLTVTQRKQIVGLCRPVDYADRGVKVLVSRERWVEWSA